MEEKKLDNLIKSFFWMASVDVIYTVEGGLPKTRKVNVLSKTLNPYLTQETLGNIQRGAQIQALEHKKIPRKAKIDDVIINGPWMIGHMTDAEYEEGKNPGNTVFIPEQEPENNGSEANAG